MHIVFVSYFYMQHGNSLIKLMDGTLCVKFFDNVDSSLIHNQLYNCFYRQYWTRHVSCLSLDRIILIGPFPPLSPSYSRPSPLSKVLLTAYIKGIQSTSRHLQASITANTTMVSWHFGAIVLSGLLGSAWYGLFEDDIIFFSRALNYLPGWQFHEK